MVDYTFFKDLFGVEEKQVANDLDAQCNLFVVDGDTLRCLANDRSYRVGNFTCPTLAELRGMVESEAAGLESFASLTVSHDATSVSDAHVAAENNGALFQAASQFNCLEMTSDTVTPEKGITGYVSDSTQGPLCALATAPALLYRNYLVRVTDGRVVPQTERHETQPRGQTADRQINNCCDLEAFLLERTGQRFWDMRNGYLRSDAARLASLTAVLSDKDTREQLKERLRIGMTREAQVTCGDASASQLVSQTWCSAVPAGAFGTTQSDWEPLARLVLEATYEATLLAGVLNARQSGNPRVILTFVGGGVFSNRTEWLIDAINIALQSLVTRGLGCDVHVNHYPEVNASIGIAIGVNASIPAAAPEDWVCSGCSAPWDGFIGRCKWCGTSKA